MNQSVHVAHSVGPPPPSMITRMHRIPQLTRTQQLMRTSAHITQHTTRNIHTTAATLRSTRIHMNTPCIRTWRASPCRYTTTVPSSSTSTSTSTSQSQSSSHDQHEHQQQHDNQHNSNNKHNTHTRRTLLQRIIAYVTRFVEWYSGHMDRHPIRVQAITSFTLFSAGMCREMRWMSCRVVSCRVVSCRVVSCDGASCV